jgi:hypothetical protein
MELMQSKTNKANSHIKDIDLEHELEYVATSKSDQRNYEIALRAYHKAEARNYESGHEMEDWLEAEAELIAESEKI